MVKSEARISTDLATRYMGQLCKHFQHKLPVTLEATHGQIDFPFGVCAVRAEDGVLILSNTSSDGETLTRLDEVVARHLERFAFRDVPEINWVRQEGV